MMDDMLGDARRSTVENPDIEEIDTVFKVVMLRSGDIEWDLGNIYCGWYDSKLTAEGRQQILAASDLLKLDNYTFDLAYCSALSRCKESLSIILNELGIPDIEVIQSWELNERHCGSLTGLIKEKQPFLRPISLMSVNFYLLPQYLKIDDEILMNKHVQVPITNDLERRIADAFEVFDYSFKNEVEIHEIGSIICSLGCVPTEEDMEQILIDLESKEIPGTVHLSDFLPYMSNIFTTHKYEPATPDTLLEAFHKLDPEGHGYVTKELLTKLLTEDGEIFSKDEIDEMMALACDPQTQTIPYEYYINQLMFDPSEEEDNYILADKIEAAKPKKEKRTVSQMMRDAEEIANAEY